MLHPVPPSKTTDELALVRRRYDRIATFYDPLEWVMELRFRRWRRMLWDLVDGDRVLELGVGTGKNIPFYPEGADIIGIDISSRKLSACCARAVSCCCSSTYCRKSRC